MLLTLSACLLRQRVLSISKPFFKKQNKSCFHVHARDGEHFLSPTISPLVARRTVLVR